MAIELRDYQLEAINQMKNGSVLCGGVGSGKSITALAYYYFKDCKAGMKINGLGSYYPMKEPKDLYIITTAKKRDSHEWESECWRFALNTDRSLSISDVKVTVDSWNNIKKYKDVYGAFFIFDEQRVVGSGAWVKAFLNITRKNHWVLLSATPGDQWTDYIPVFIANGFYKNRTEFNTRHCVYSRFSKYPKIEKYMDERLLRKHRDDILVNMKDDRMTIRHVEYINVEYDHGMFKSVFRNRWDPFENCPIQEVGKLYYLLRKVVNADSSRITKTAEIINRKKRCIVFYNFSYELELLRDMCDEYGFTYAEWNGQCHEDLPEGEQWVYLVQYTAGCEGWNCITCDTIVFYSQSYSYRQTEQAAGRIDRINTPYKDLYYYHLKSTAWIDVAIYRALKRKQNFNESSYHLKIGA